MRLIDDVRRLLSAPVNCPAKEVLSEIAIDRARF
jgi:hypothetical protein